MDPQFFIKKSRELRRNMTDAEKLLWSRIRNKKIGPRFNRQHIFDNKYIVDFYCANKKLIIEIDGGQHCENLKDKIRDDYFQNRGYKVIRLWNNDVLYNIEGCLLMLYECIEEIPS